METIIEQSAQEITWIYFHYVFSHFKYCKKYQKYCQIGFMLLAYIAYIRLVHFIILCGCTYQLINALPHLTLKRIR